MNALEKAAGIIGSQAKLAGFLGVSKAAVNQWKLPGRKVPLKHCLPIEQITKGKVTCEELRPDINWTTMRASVPPAADSRLPHTTHTRATNGNAIGTPLRRRATDKQDKETV
jgi:DNA-binding transcriptional regulator YdaS (Cro superfamily)